MGETSIVCVSAWVLLSQDSIRHNHSSIPRKNAVVVVVVVLTVHLLQLQSGWVTISSEKALSKMVHFHFKDCNQRHWNVNPMLQMQALGQAVYLGWALLVDGTWVRGGCDCDR